MLENINGLRLKYFTDEQIAKIHANGLDILESHGFKCEHQGALEILKDQGAKVDFEKQIVKVKPDLVKKCIRSGISKFTMGARDPEKNVTVEHNPRFPVRRNGGGVDKLIDMETGQFRDMLLSDTKELFHVLDAMDAISLISPLYPHDVPESYRDVAVLETMFNHTSKHVNIRTFSKENLKVLVEMGLLVAGGQEEFRQCPVFSIFDSPLSPLKFPELTVEVFLTAGEYGIPLYMANLPIAGATGPFTLAGMVQLLHTELLASVVICQSAHPGAPMLLHPLAMTMDWQTLVGLSASIESTMITAGIIQVANEIFKMPVDVHGPWSDTYIADSQSMLERTFQVMLPTLSGAASIAGFGDVQEGLAFCPIQLGMDEELIGFTMKSLEGIPFDDDRLAVEAIKRVGFGGDFMVEETTLKYLRSDYYQPRILNRLAREDWEAAGRKELNSAAKQRVKKLMKEHQPEPLEPGLQKELRKLVKSRQ
ncbi:MAG: trimethylamine methyltransferase family protein [Sedimentisphaerales bacterium]|nr:trimethylamine methyltransferase family protein [Sedimentisphaerales bacterium]